MSYITTPLLPMERSDRWAYEGAIDYHYHVPLIARNKKFVVILSGEEPSADYAPSPYPRIFVEWNIEDPKNEFKYAYIPLKLTSWEEAKKLTKKLISDMEEGCFLTWSMLEVIEEAT